ncbi:response regulator [Natronorubrum sp. JWXQ-INN-674]|uniref:Response regulator n=1 Tax=Natronorubrum halalkaliphilum TaxID=2691917 RepID=A0A6B0VI67_9EURY|nr:response regulator [Natronorubrum halalkaliphilum]MXV61258.1 response regulator [Natronorubrum halalkaliphilum]
MSTHRHRSDEPIEILLVEDNPGDVQLIERAVESTATETVLHVVDNGDDAVTALTERDGDDAVSPPDIVLLDLGLPGKDGHEILDAIRSSQDLRSLPVIVLTSSDASDDIAGCYDAEANAYVTKPTDVNEFAAVVEAVEAFWFDHVQLPPKSR